jgi:hypothetical protein
MEFYKGVRPTARWIYIEEYRELYEYPYLKAKDTLEFITLTRRMACDAAFREQARGISRILLRQFDKQEIRKKWLALYRGQATL